MNSLHMKYTRIYNIRCLTLYKSSVKRLGVLSSKWGQICNIRSVSILPTSVSCLRFSCFLHISLAKSNKFYVLYVLCGYEFIFILLIKKNALLFSFDVFPVSLCMTEMI